MIEDILLAVGAFLCFALIAVVVIAGISTHSCSDGFVYLNTDTFQGCVPYEYIKENE